MVGEQENFGINMLGLRKIKIELWGGGSRKK